MEHWERTLRNLKNQNLYREITAYDPVDGATVLYAGRPCIMLASNNYLGLTCHPAVKQAAIAAVTRYGAGAGGSRLTTGSNSLYTALENTIARFKGTESAIVFNTGYMANVGAVSSLAGPGDYILSDELNHASIIDGCRLAKATVLVYRHCDTGDLKKKLAALPRTANKLIVTDGVFSMDGDIAPLPDLVTLAQQYGAAVMVDDAHATGVLGEKGGGTRAFFRLKSGDIIQMGTLSKALASEGGYIAGSQVLIDFLRNRARSLIFSTALGPAAVGAAKAAIETLEKEPGLIGHLRDNGRYMREKLAALGFHVPPGITPIIPVIIGDAGLTMQFAAGLRDEGVIVSGIRPPTVPAGSSRLRVTVTAAHTREHLDTAITAFARVARRLRVR